MALTFSRSSKSQKKGDNAPISRACVPMDIKWLRILVISPNRAITDQRRPWQCRVIMQKVVLCMNTMAMSFGKRLTSNIFGSDWNINVE